MKWRRRHAAPPERPAVEPPPFEPSAETRRAEAAAARAAADLAELRRLAPKIAASGEELADLNSHNGFSSLIRAALGS
jgi:hypothetical protein